MPLLEYGNRLNLRFRYLRKEEKNNFRYDKKYAYMVIYSWNIYKSNRIRIIGAGYWRKGKNIYEKQNQI